MAALDLLLDLNLDISFSADTNDMCYQIWC